MVSKQYPRLGETVFHEILENGLHIYVDRRRDFQKSYAFFATNYGGMDMRFRLDGAWKNTPAGVAHFLEHKMFDTQDGNALQDLAANGASPNAFTSSAITGYFFESTDKFFDNLESLLSFVSIPWFTQESVDKEQGIIGQEIRMVEDDPENQVFYPARPQELDPYFCRLQQEFFSASPYREEAAHCLATELFIALSRSLAHPAGRKEEMAALYPSFQKLRLEMLSNCEQDWSLERLCRAVSLEKSQFYSYYHSFFSSTPKNDLLQVRLEKAKNLLSNEALQVSEVARLCGFGNLAHFSRYFRKYCGYSPRAYREVSSSVCMYSDSRS